MGSAWCPARFTEFNEFPSCVQSPPSPVLCRYHHICIQSASTMLPSPVVPPPSHLTVHRAKDKSDLRCVNECTERKLSLPAPVLCGCNSICSGGIMVSLCAAPQTFSTTTAWDSHGVNETAGLRVLHECTGREQIPPAPVLCGCCGICVSGIVVPLHTAHQPPSTTTQPLEMSTVQMRQLV